MFSDHAAIEQVTRNQGSYNFPRVLLSAELITIFFTGFVVILHAKDSASYVKWPQKTSSASSCVDEKFVTQSCCLVSEVYPFFL